MFVPLMVRDCKLVRFPSSIGISPFKGLSLRNKYSKYKLIVYGFNCTPNIKLPNVINKRIDYRPKPKISGDIIDQYGNYKNLFFKDYSIFFAKFLASLDSFNENYENYEKSKNNKTKKTYHSFLSLE